MAFARVPLFRLIIPESAKREPLYLLPCVPIQFQADLYSNAPYLGRFRFALTEHDAMFELFVIQ
jgi:hypothetical protein